MMLIRTRTAPIEQTVPTAIPTDIIVTESLICAGGEGGRIGGGGLGGGLLCGGGGIAGGVGNGGGTKR